MGPLLLQLLQELQKREQNVKHKEKREDYKRTFILKVLFKDVLSFQASATVTRSRFVSLPTNFTLPMLAFWRATF